LPVFESEPYLIFQRKLLIKGKCQWKENAPAGKRGWIARGGKGSLTQNEGKKKRTLTLKGGDNAKGVGPVGNACGRKGA